ncbi:hypothetical protein ACVXZZ_00560 [Staphylococcus aureus]
MNYNHNQIEKKWQDYWDENKTFKTNDNLGQKKFYALDMFPYPSGAGLHVGHLRAIQQQISFQDIKECKDIMYYIRWVGCIRITSRAICFRHWQRPT